MDGDVTGPDRLRWGLLAAGAIAAEFAEGVRESETGVVHAIASRDLRRAEAFAAAHGVPVSYGSYEELLADPAVDAVYVATPHPFHAQWAIRAADAGKHLLCEKPIGLDEADARAIVEAARRNDVFLMEGFMYRVHPQTLKVIELLEQGAIGRVRLIDLAFSFGPELDASERLFSHDLGGGAILDIGCYLTSFARLVAAQATGRTSVEPMEIAAVGYVDPDDRVDHFALASLRFPGEVFAQLSCSIRQTQEQRLRLYGDVGVLSVAAPSWCTWMPEHQTVGASTIVVDRAGESTETIEVSAPRSLYAYEADHVAAQLARGQSPALSWADSIENMRTLDRWRAAIGLAYGREPGEEG